MAWLLIIAAGKRQMTDRSERFDRTQFRDNRLPLRHPQYAQSQSDGRDDRKTFKVSSNRERD